MMKYQLTISYNDCTGKCETADLPSIMQALSIYTEDPDVFTICIINCQTGELLADWENINGIGLTAVS